MRAIHVEPHYHNSEHCYVIDCDRDLIATLSAAMLSEGYDPETVAQAKTDYEAAA